MTNLVQFPGLGLSFELSRVAFSIGDIDIYWYGICIAFGLCLALVFAFRRCTEFGIDADSMVFSGSITPFSTSALSILWRIGVPFGQTIQRHGERSAQLNRDFWASG